MEFITRKDCVAYLVKNGAHPGMAKAAIDQYCNYDSNDATDDAIRRGSDDLDDSCRAIADGTNADGWVACVVDEAFVISVYRTAASMMIIWGGLIYFDNEPQYYEDGEVLPLRLMQINELDEKEKAALDAANYTGTRSLFYS